ncbi:UBX domain-containing protein 2A, partial [Leucoagaricus sp. SymC.cos]
PPGFGRIGDWSKDDDECDEHSGKENEKRESWCAGGKRSMVCRMNLTHTVGDIRNFINALCPENLSRPYSIGATFPNRVLEDDSATIESAGLVNSVIVQRWI